MEKTIDDIATLSFQQYIGRYLIFNPDVNDNTTMADAERYFNSQVGDDWWENKMSFREAVRTAMPEGANLAQVIRGYATNQRKQDAEDVAIGFVLNNGLKAVEARRQDKIDEELGMFSTPLTAMETLIKSTELLITLSVQTFPPKVRNLYKKAYDIKTENKLYDKLALTDTSEDVMNDNESKRYASLQSRFNGDFCVD